MDSVEGTTIWESPDVEKKRLGDLKRTMGGADEEPECSIELTTMDGDGEEGTIQHQLLLQTMRNFTFTAIVILHYYIVLTVNYIYRFTQVVRIRY